MLATFVRVDILDNWRFWHRFGDDYEAAGREALAQADALLAGDEEANERAGQLLREARLFRDKKAAAGRLGGKAKAQRDSRQSATNNANDPLPTGRPLGPAGGKACSSDGDDQGAASARLDCAFARPENFSEEPPSTSDLYQFVIEDGLDEADAREWWEIHDKRGWVDRTGCPVRNWKGALKRFCAAKAKKRRLGT